MENGELALFEGIGVAKQALKALTYVIVDLISKNHVPRLIVCAAMHNQLDSRRFSEENPTAIFGFHRTDQLQRRAAYGISPRVLLQQPAKSRACVSIERIIGVSSLQSVVCWSHPYHVAILDHSKASLSSLERPPAMKIS